MKSALTAIAIAALLLAAGPADAALVDTFDWQGGTVAWSTAGNWDTDAEGYPGPSNCADVATIADDNDNPVLLSENITIGTFTMSNDTSLDVYDLTLSVDGTATFSDPSGNSVSNIAISNGSGFSGGGITAECMVFDGGQDGLIVTVSGSTTLQTAAVSCP